MKKKILNQPCLLKKNLTIAIISALFFGACSPKQNEVSTTDPSWQWAQGAIVRGDTSKKQLALVFTGHEFADGGHYIQKVLHKHKVPASFFFTGDFYRNTAFSSLIKKLITDGHYLGAHSDQHLLYCDWNKRDSLLLNKATFLADVKANYNEMARFGINPSQVPYFLPPYEWYNDTISQWTHGAGLQLINISYGTRSHADYTTPEMPNYINSEAIFQSILKYEAAHSAGLNGFILLIHTGTDPKRTDKFYLYLGDLIEYLKSQGYQLQRIDELLKL